MTEKVKRKLTVRHLKCSRRSRAEPSRKKPEILTINASDEGGGTEKWSWLGHVLRMPEHRLVRQVLLNLRQTYPRDAFRRRTKSKYRERYKNV